MEAYYLINAVYMITLGGLEIQVYQEEDGSYYACVENLPGCFTMAETLTELDGNIREAITSYLLSVQKDLPKYQFNISTKDVIHA